MSLRIPNIDHTCTGCSKIYTPLYENYPCPNCKEINEVEFTFLEHIIWMMKHNKATYGRFTPNGMYINGVSANIQRIVYMFFDQVEQEPLKSLDEYLEENLSEIQKYFGEEMGYLVPNATDAIKSIHARYLLEDYFVVQLTKREMSTLQKWRRWWRMLIP